MENIENTTYYNFNLLVSDKDKIEHLQRLQISTNMSLFEKTSADEFNNLKKFFINKLEIKKVLDLGCGIGRSSIFFKNMLDMSETTFYLADFDGIEYSLGNPCGYHNNVKPIPYNDLKITKEFCEINNMKDFKIINLKNNDLKEIKNINLIYSFHSIGFHWSIKESFYEYRLNNISSENCKLIFGIQKIGTPEYPDKIENFKLIENIEGKEFQNFLIYEKQ